MNERHKLGRLSFLLTRVRSVAMVFSPSRRQARIMVYPNTSGFEPEVQQLLLSSGRIGLTYKIGKPSLTNHPFLTP